MHYGEIAKQGQDKFMKCFKMKRIVLPLHVCFSSFFFFQSKNKKNITSISLIGIVAERFCQFRSVDQTYT